MKPEQNELIHFPAVLNASDIVAYRRRLGRHPKIENLKGVLFCLERGLPRKLRWKIPAHLVGRMNGDVYGIKRTQDKVVVITDFGGGSPIVAELAEEFAAMGAQKMILLTWGGGLQTTLAAGDIIVCDRAARDEGTSSHYLPPAPYVDGNSSLAGSLNERIKSKGINCKLGLTWTTDAPYRETRQAIEHYQSEGALTVEMESAGLFTIGQVRAVKTASLVVVMDNLAAYKWIVPDRLTPIQKSLEIAYRAAIDVLAG